MRRGDARQAFRRRYVVTAAGAYPAAVPPRTSSEPVLSVGESDAPPRVLIAPQEPDLDAIVASPTFAPLPERQAKPVPPRTFTRAAPPLGQPSAVPRAWARTALRRMLIGALGGGLVGVMTGLLLLALSRPGDPLMAITDPVTLWRSVNDEILKLAAGVVVVGFALLGAAATALRLLDADAGL